MDLPRPARRLGHYIVTRPPWIWVVFYVGLIYATLPFGRTVVDALRASHLLAVVIMSLAGISVAGLTLIATKTRIWQRPKALLMLVAGVIALGIYATFLPVWEERVHLVQYAVLGLLVGWATPATWRFRFLLACILTCLLGYGDEVIQYFLPSRVFDWRDVAFNAIAGTYGAAAFALLFPPSRDAR